MKFKLIITLLIVTFSMKAQDVNYKFTGPIKKINGYVFGNEENGFIKVDYNYMTLRIHKIDEKNYSTKEISITSDFYGVVNAGHIEVNNFSYWFYAKKGIPYVIKIDLKGNISEPLKLRNEEVNLYFNVDFDINNNFFILNYAKIEESYEKQLIDISIFDLDLNNVKNYKKSFSRELPNPYTLKSPYYDSSKEKLYFGGRYVTKKPKAWSSGLASNAIYSLNSSEELELIESSDTEFEILSSTFYKQDEEIKFIGIIFNKENQSLHSFIYDFKEDIFLHKEKINFIQHSNYLNNKIESISFSCHNLFSKLNEDGSIINISKISLKMGGNLSNILITKYDQNSTILYNKIIPISSFDYELFKFESNLEFIYIVYKDFLEKTKINNKDYNGNYILASKIDNNGKGDSKVLFNSELRDKTKLYHVFKKSFNPNPQTFVTYAYKKKKEDLIIKVEFDD